MCGDLHWAKFYGTDLTSAQLYYHRSNTACLDPVWDAQTRWPAGLTGYLMAMRLCSWSSLRLPAYVLIPLPLLLTAGRLLNILPGTPVALLVLTLVAALVLGVWRSLYVMRHG